MKDRIQQLIALFMTARPATRITLVLGTIVMGAFALFSSWYAARPDLVLLWSGMTSAQTAEYRAALAQAEIPFRSSPPPENGIWVNAKQRMQAEAQVALAGYRPVEKGIQVTAGGASSAFMSAGSRAQQVNKREWEECEKQLERLIYIERATVASSGVDPSPYSKSKEPTISVTLGLRNGLMLDSSQARTVAALVRGRFNVPLENITIVDEHLNLLYDGLQASGGMSSGDLYSIKRRYDTETERAAMKTLTMALGEGMATVTVNSTWLYDESESVTESSLPSAAPYFEATTNSTNSIPGASVGGPAGISSNITAENFGIGNAGQGSSGADGGKQTSDTTETHSSVGRKTEHLTSRTPKITRLTLGLTLDESAASKLAEIEGVVKATVGFDEARGDVFKVWTMPLASVERDEDGQPIAPIPPEPKAKPNPYVELALQHGVEILAALGFLIVLMKSLKSASNLKTAPAAAPEAGAPSIASGARGSDLTQAEIDQMDMELLARAQVEELVRSDPEKVSEILAHWVTSAAGPVGAGK